MGLFLYNILILNKKVVHLYFKLIKMTEIRKKIDFDIPDEIKTIFDIFKANGFKLFVVGGAVRDAILGITPKDFDLATDATPDVVEHILSEEGFVTLATGKSFGVINVFVNDQEFEIATFRIDNGSGRRPESVTFTTIEGDVKRRDLTINALFFDLETSEVVDLVGGLNDLKLGTIRTVGNAKDRFEEDRLRILRAIRFSGRFGSDLDSDIILFLVNDSSLAGVSPERIRDEFLKGVRTAKSVPRFLSLLERFALFKEIFPNLNVNTRFNIDDDELVVLASLLQFNDLTKLPKVLNKLTFSKNEIKGIMFLISLQSLDSETVVKIKKKQKDSFVTTDQILNFTTREGIPSQLIDAFLEFELTVDGEALMLERGLKPSKELGDLIEDLEIENFKNLLGFNV